MKTLISIKPKYKLALVLLVMASLILAGLLMERKYFKNVNTSSASIYNDRLIPAIAIFHLSDHLTQRRLLVEEQIGKGPLPEHLQTYLSDHSLAMDSILRAFEETYLVKAEFNSLELLKQYLDEYNQTEQLLLQNHRESIGSEKIHNQLQKDFENIRSELIELSAIQNLVGKELMADTKHTVAQAHNISDFQIAVLLITCIIAQMLIIASKAITPSVRQKYELN